MLANFCFGVAQFLAPRTLCKQKRRRRWDEVTWVRVRNLTAVPFYLVRVAQRTSTLWICVFTLIWEWHGQYLCACGLRGSFWSCLLCLMFDEPLIGWNCARQSLCDMHFWMHLFRICIWHARWRNRTWMFRWTNKWLEIGFKFQWFLYFCCFGNVLVKCEIMKFCNFLQPQEIHFTILSLPYGDFRRHC